VEDVGGRRKREERRWVEGSGGERRGGERVHDRRGKGKTRSRKGAEIAGKGGREEEPGGQSGEAC
jgi:hypothetical protein